MPQENSRLSQIQNYETKSLLRGCARSCARGCAREKLFGESGGRKSVLILVQFLYKLLKSEHLYMQKSTQFSSTNYFLL